MPRKPRLYLAGIPGQVIQRGDNREAGFFSESKQGESSA
jgi:putative transposase